MVQTICCDMDVQRSVDYADGDQKWCPKILQKTLILGTAQISWRLLRCMFDHSLIEGDLSASVALHISSTYAYIPGIKPRSL